MTTLTSRDRRLWNDLICACLRPDVKNVSEIRKAANMAAGAQKNFKFKRAAALPDSEYNAPGVINPDSVFVKLTGVGRNLRVDDAISRELLRDYAHRARRILNGQPDGAPPPVAAQVAKPLPPEAEDAEGDEPAWRKRRDIGG